MKIATLRIAHPALLALILLAYAPEAYCAATLKIPLNFDSGFIRDCLLQQVFTEPGEQRTIVDEAGGCSRFVLARPQVEVQMRGLSITARGSARMGDMRQEGCSELFAWTGRVELAAEPWLDPATSSVALKITGCRVLDESGSPDLSPSGFKLASIVKTNLYPRMEAFQVDFSNQLAELRAMLPSMLPNRPEEAKTLADSLTVKRLKMAPDGRGVLIEIKVPPSFARPQQEERIAGLWQQQQQRRLERWDAFLTFAIKSLARRDGGPERKKILAALLDARYAIAQMQVDDGAGGRKNLPQLFTQTWEQVRAATLEAAAGTGPGRKAQGITSFVSAADVAVSLSREGQDSGIELSDDSLRMISRKLDPQTAEDPVSYSTAVDPELRNLLGFGDPLPAPSIPSDFAESAVAPLLQRLQYLLSVPEALAETDAYAALKRWAPDKDDAATYLPLVRQLLADTANEALARKDLDPRYHDLYRTTVLATAWQESCWRQFTMKGNKLAVITSPNGTSVGIMQINQKVWRGIYDPAGLSGDIVYNARAGSEILLHYLCDYALEQKEHLQPGGDLARACYAVYNAGPGRLARYRMPGTSPAEKKIDALWLRRYTALRDGRQAEAAECF